MRAVFSKSLCRSNHNLSAHSAETVVPQNRLRFCDFAKSISQVDIFIRSLLGLLSIFHYVVADPYPLKCRRLTRSVCSLFKTLQYACCQPRV